MSEWCTEEQYRELLEDVRRVHKGVLPVAQFIGFDFRSDWASRNEFILSALSRAIITVHVMGLSQRMVLRRYAPLGGGWSGRYAPVSYAEVRALVNRSLARYVG